MPVHISCCSHVNNESYTSFTKTFILSGLCVSVMAITIVHLLQKAQGSPSVRLILIILQFKKLLIQIDVPAFQTYLSYESSPSSSLFHIPLHSCVHLSGCQRCCSTRSYCHCLCYHFRRHLCLKRRGTTPSKPLQILTLFTAPTCILSISAAHSVESAFILSV